MWEKYLCAKTTDEAVHVLHEHGNKSRIVAGATDIMLEMERGVRKGIETLVDVTRIPELNTITLDEQKNIHIGATITHNQVVASKLIREFALPLALASWEVGSPQIRNRGTVVGNVITASPANDTITPLMALGANVLIKSSEGERLIPLDQFYTGVRKNVLMDNEMVVEVVFPAMKTTQRGVFTKYALRMAQAISLVNIAIVLDFDGENIQHASITLGAVAPTIIHAKEAETYLVGKQLTSDVIEKAAEITMNAAHPISDVRASASYRLAITKVITRRSLIEIRDDLAKSRIPASPVFLWGKNVNGVKALDASQQFDQKSTIKTNINGKEYTFQTGQNKSLLRLLREDAGLIGSKEGCAEGECGACTVFLDGKAVMSCMVPAPRAHNAKIVTIEGLANQDQLHPIQQAFIHEGAVQCGYCTPGFLMSAAMLLEEKPSPSQEEIKQAITGNLCRCTGYYKIIEAIEAAANNLENK
jgi:xanthine dehydrogenase iron-sulfur cluster and FAD-binding subunit A